MTVYVVFIVTFVICKRNVKERRSAAKNLNTALVWFVFNSILTYFYYEMYRICLHTEQIKSRKLSF